MKSPGALLTWLRSLLGQTRPAIPSRTMDDQVEQAMRMVNDTVERTERWHQNVTRNIPEDMARGRDTRRQWG